MKILLKDGTEAKVEDSWVHEWASLYWMDDITVAIEKARLWCLDNPQKRKTKRGLRAFLGNWIRRDCRLKPQVRMVKQEIEPKPEHNREIVSNHLNRMKELLK